MKRMILKSKIEPVEIHIIGDDAIEHALKIIDGASTAMFLGVEIETLNDFRSFSVESDIDDHKYPNGNPIQLGDRVEIEIAKGVFKRGEIKFQQQAYCFASFESGTFRFTPLCCFGKNVKFHKV
jgi:hypothetical protein